MEEFNQNNSTNQYMRMSLSPEKVVCIYDFGAITKVEAETLNFDLRLTKVQVFTKNGEIYSWQTNNIYLVGYIMYGIPVSHDGRFVFAQQDMKGLLCLDAKDGHIIWKTQSRAEYSNVLVGDTHLCCSKSRNEIQLIDIENGNVIKSYRTPFDNRFEVLTDRFIVNHTKSKSWEVLSSETLDVVQEIPDKLFGQNRRSIEMSYKNKN